MAEKEESCAESDFAVEEVQTEAKAVINQIASMFRSPP
jgi:hypothetical protein